MVVKILKLISVILLITLGVSKSVASVDYSQRKEVQQFVADMVKKYKFNKDALLQRFSSAEKLEGVLEKIAKPAEKTLTWKQYRPIFVTAKRIKKGID